MIKPKQHRKQTAEEKAAEIAWILAVQAHPGFGQAAKRLLDEQGHRPWA